MLHWIYEEGKGGVRNTKWVFCPRCRMPKPFHISENIPKYLTEMRLKMPQNGETVCISSLEEIRCRYMIFEKKRFATTSPITYIGDYSE